ncbi:hypothetical protein CJJ18_01385 [Candidatus Williamhamiltonella defendens]|uniref:Uncharacterized protein n=1 Tax=Candidatus Williamhamiltonella defendens TaxID=138072 RepID=A0AAC9YEU0_9ENTR|nr:hypothetical protein CJJ18_01385 [Candidatus Hamiltonella defensa]
MKNRQYPIKEGGFYKIIEPHNYLHISHLLRFLSKNDHLIYINLLSKTQISRSMRQTRLNIKYMT